MNLIVAEIIITKKYENLRTKWCKERNKVVASKKSGAGAADIYKPTWEWFEALSFLESSVVDQATVHSLVSSHYFLLIDLPFMVYHQFSCTLQPSTSKVSTHPSTSSSAPESSSEYSSTQEPQSEPESTSAPTASSAPTPSSNQLTSTPTLPASLPTAALSSSSTVVRKRKRNDALSQFLNQASEALRHVGEIPATPKMDRFDRYGANIADMIRDLNDPRRQQKLMLKIDKLIYDFTSIQPAQHSEPTTCGQCQDVSLSFQDL